MNNTILHRTILITRLILIVPVTLVALCAGPTIGLSAFSAHQNDIGNTDSRSPTCAPSYSPRLGIGIGELHGQVLHGRRSDAVDSTELSPVCANDSPFAIRIDWIVGRSTLWSIEL